MSMAFAKGTSYMSKHCTTLEWKRESEDFSYQSYNRKHYWTFDSGVTIPASAASSFLGDSDYINPEEAFVAALTSCHMVTFLTVAAKKRFVVDRYNDTAVGLLEKNVKGRIALTQVTLRPIIVFGEEQKPSKAELQNMHDIAHRQCFIANSVKTKVTIDYSLDSIN